MKRTRRHPETDRVTAFHEAGHAIVAFKLNIRLKKVSIVGGEGYRGSVWHSGFIGGRPDVETTDKMVCSAERQVMVSLAGLESQRRYRKSSVRNYHGHSDYQSAFNMLFRFSSRPEEVKLWLKLLQIRTRNIVESPMWWPVIEGFAALLLEKRSMTGPEAEAGIRQQLDAQLERGASSRMGSASPKGI